MFEGVEKNQASKITSPPRPFFTARWTTSQRVSCWFSRKSGEYRRSKPRHEMRYLVIQSNKTISWLYKRLVTSAESFNCLHPSSSGLLSSKIYCFLHLRDTNGYPQWLSKSWKARGIPAVVIQKPVFTFPSHSSCPFSSTPSSPTSSPRTVDTFLKKFCERSH